VPSMAGENSQLDLTGCRSLKELPEQLGQLQGLQLLDLSGCRSLQVLPQSIGQLTALTHLSLNMCSSLSYIPASIARLGRLKQLHMSECTSLRELPDLHDLSQLQDLVLRECSSLECLPWSIGILSALKHLNLAGCTGLITLPDTIGGSKALQVLDCRSCTGLVALPELLLQLSDLHWLDISGCVQLPCPGSLASVGASLRPRQLLQFMTDEQHKRVCIPQRPPMRHAADHARSAVEPHQTASTNRRVTVVYGELRLVCGLLSLATYNGLSQGLVVAASPTVTVVVSASPSPTAGSIGTAEQQDSSLEYVFRFCNGMSFVASLCCIMVSLVAVMSLNYMPLMAGDPCDAGAQREFIRQHGPEGALLSAKGNRWLNKLYAWSLASFTLSMFAICTACIVVGLYLMGYHSLGPAVVAVSGVLFIVICVLLGLRRRFQDLFEAPTNPDEEMGWLPDASSCGSHYAAYRQQSSSRAAPSWGPDWGRMKLYELLLCCGCTRLADAIDWF
jgi:hypothetical protein